MSDLLTRFAGWFGKQEGTAPTGGPHPQTKGIEMFKDSKSKIEGQEDLAIPDPTGGGEFRKKLRWWIKEQPDKAVTINITPAQAMEMLAYNDRNRPVSPKTISRYAAEMSAKNWRYTRVPIIFSDQERLIDGQHRLMACVESGVAFGADVVFGAPDDSFYYIDVGKKRGASDIFCINGVPNHKMAAAATRILMAYKENRAQGWSAISYGGSLEDVYNAYLEFPGLQGSIKAAGHVFTRDRMPQPSAATAIHYLCAQKNRTLANEYFGKVSSGVGFKNKQDPAYRVREYLTREDSNAHAKHAMAALIQGWNAIRTNKRLGKINTENVGRVA